MMRLRAFARLLIMACVLGTSSAINTPSHASMPTASEQTLVAAFLYNFLKFTEWPEGTFTHEIVLCTSKGNAFEELDAISGRIAHNKSIRIKRVSQNESFGDCQLLFLPREEGPERIRQWLAYTENKPILIVSNISEFLDIGGMIALINDGKNLNFEVNLERVRRSSLKLSAQLLQIAREVRGR